MVNKEYKLLLQGIRNVDLSANNPEMQAVIEQEMKGWVKSYKNKKTSSYFDCYGGPGEIPNQIAVNKKKYSPEQILNHVKQRDEVGMIVIRKIDECQKKDSAWFENKKLAECLETLGENLEQVVFYCTCGKHKQTLRDVMEGIIHPNSESIFIKASLPDAIKRWYKNSK